ncbi:MAG: hypothetical protein ACYSWU_22860 [Planctomycetota bacterium]|jgi:hypothetical protein
MRSFPGANLVGRKETASRTFAQYLFGPLYRCVQKADENQLLDELGEFLSEACSDIGHNLQLAALAFILGYPVD